MEIAAILARLRDGHGLSPQDAQHFARGLADGTVEDAQAGAFAMAVLLCGLNKEGRVALTLAMRDSGRVMDWSTGTAGDRPIVDKHSTGGVGDPVSLLLAPALAALGAMVPMISGRGLGHTGGTLDKLSALDGYQSEVSGDHLARVLAETGCAIVSAGPDLAPADRRLYAIRDICGAVESLDLITASILSKKLAAGLGGLVMDVKCGSGAFMTEPEDARRLARALVETANGAGCPTVAHITDMNSPLARSAGNAVELAEVFRLFRDGPDGSALWQVTRRLGAEALCLAGLVQDREQGAAAMDRVLASGQAAERFCAMVRALGGPKDALCAPLPRAPVIRDVTIPPAHIAAIDTRALGEIVVTLGGGRRRQGDRIDPRVGLTHLPRVGDHTGHLGQVHAASVEAAEAAARALCAAVTGADNPVPPDPLFLDRIA